MCCCNKPNKSANYQKAIKADIDNQDEVSIFDIFEKIEVIPLETNDSCLIRGINKVICHNNLFYIFDEFENKLLAFDNTGKFNYKIDDKGQGPEDYIRLSDFDIDKEKDILSLLDPTKSEISEYNLEGHFLRKYKLPEIIGAYDAIKHLNNNVIAFWTYDYDNRLKFISKDNNQIFNECFPEENDMFRRVTMQFVVYENYLSRSVDNNVYKILPEGTTSIAYTWDFGKLNVNHSTLNKPDPRKMGREEISNFGKKISASEVINYIFTRTGAGGNSDYIYSQILRKDKYINIWHHKTNNKTVVFEKTTEGACFFPVFWTEEFVIGNIPEVYFNAVLSDGILDEENIIKKNQRSEDDNPILVKYYFKK